MRDDADDLRLLEQCIQGQRRAWNTLVERFTRYVYYLIQLTAKRYSVPLTEEEVADLHNDLFVALMEDDCRRLRAFGGKNGCSVRSWIRVITIRRTLDAFRKRRNHVSLDAEIRDGLAPIDLLESGEPDPLEALLAARDSERRGQLDELLDQLKDRDRALMDLLYAQRLSVDETAAALNINRGALYTRKTRIIKRLRDLAEAAGLLDEPH